MWKRRGPGLIIVASLSVSLAVILFWRDNGPYCRGRSLCRWLEIYDTTTRESERDLEAKAAILRIGTNTLPYALRWIQEKPVVAIHSWSDDQEERTRGDIAVRVFEILGPAAAMTTQQLQKLANADGPGKFHAIDALVSIGPLGLPGLIAIATNTSLAWRRHAILSIEQLGTNATPAVPALISCLQDPDPDIRMVACDVLVRLNLQSPTLLALFTTKLSDPDLAIRLRAIHAIAEYGANAAASANALIALQNDENHRVRFRAGKALLKVQAIPQAQVN